MNKIIEFFNSELCFWINLSLALIGISLWFLNWVLLQMRLKRMSRENAEYLNNICYGMIGLREEGSYVGGKTRLLTDLVLEQEKKYIEALTRLPESDEKSFILRSLRHGEAIERKNNIVCEEENKFIDQIVCEKKEIEDQKLYFDNIAFPYDELVEMRRLGRHHCTAPPYFVSVQRPDSYKEDKPDET